MKMKLCGTVAAVFLVILFFEEGSTRPLISTSTRALEYLVQFGHAPKTELGSAPSAQVDRRTALRQALLSFQFMAGINQTGELDAKTMEMMNTPRCGLPDHIGSSGAMSDGQGRRRKRYEPQGSRWSKTQLTYNFTNYTPQLPQTLVRNIVEKAFKLWSDASSLTFSESQSADMEFLYKALYHGDEYPFDGRGGTLAHAFFPNGGTLAGDAHFDEAELWTDGVNSGTNLLQVTTHELGHSLGLSHSVVSGAVMAPFYSGYIRNFQLTTDDIAGIQYLYGPKQSATTTGRTTTTTGRTTTTTTTTGKTTTTTTTKTTTTKSPTTPAVPSICRDAVIDAIVVIGQTTYVFKGALYYVLNDVGIQDGYPRRISDTWPEVSGYVDTVLYFPEITGDSAQLFFFKGNMYWKYDGITTLSTRFQYPRLIQDGFPGIPTFLDAAFIWSGNGKVYFVKGDSYYRYTRGVGADDGYPRSMSIWGGVPTPISSAFQWTNQRTFFFVGAQYYRFNDDNLEVDAGYPRPTSYWWFGCPDTLTAGALRMNSNQAPASIIHEDNHDVPQQLMNPRRDEAIGNRMVAPSLDQPAQGSCGHRSGVNFHQSLIVVIALFFCCSYRFLMIH